MGAGIQWSLASVSFISTPAFVSHRILGVEIRGRRVEFPSLLSPPPSFNLLSLLPFPLLSSLSPSLLSFSVLTSPLCTPLIPPHPQ